MNRFPDTVDRRTLLQRTACGFGGLALQSLLAEALPAASPSGVPASPSARPQRQPHVVPRAKRVIFIFMQGGPSHVDTFDYKPELIKQDGKSVEFFVARSMQVSRQRVFKSPWKFAQYGECGHWVSELFPHIARRVDDLCFIHSMHTEGVAHGPATLFLHTGATNLIRPSVGAWVSYGLGTENRNLPAFVTICPPATKGGPRNYSNAFLPTEHQGTAFGHAGQPVARATLPHLTNPALSLDEQRRHMQRLSELNRLQLQRRNADDELQAAVRSFELAFRMQLHAPKVFDISSETAATQAMYGIGQSATDDFGRQCLLARRLAEAGVRFVQVTYGDNANTPRWDQHSNLPKHADHARATDQPVAALLLDLKQRGLLEDTLVWWGGEFGRTPFAQGNNGRDHNPKGFTVFLAGGGVKPGFSFGATDEFGDHAAVDKVHMHDLHATVLHLLGLDHERLTYRHAGRDFRLTDVSGRVVREIFERPELG